ncbi:MAG: SGNH/GDSL hydrolase family protein [Myxococcota bacterium]
MKTLLALLLLISSLTGCGDASSGEPPSDMPNAGPPLGAGAGPVLAIGDSILDWHSDTAQSIPEVYGATADRSVANRAIGGARLLAGERSIPSQYVASARNYSRVLLDGGGNDVGGDGCGCGDCRGMVDLIINAQATEGRLVQLIDTIIADGADVVLLGYYMPPPFGEFSECRDEFAALNQRYAALAASRPPVRFVNMGDVVVYTDRPDYFDDPIHPSIEGSRVIGEYIAQQLAEGS